MLIRSKEKIKIMIISKEAYESFLKVKELIKRPQIKYSNEEFLLLSEVLL